MEFLGDGMALVLFEQYFLRCVILMEFLGCGFLSDFYVTVLRARCSLPEFVFYFLLHNYIHVDNGKYCPLIKIHRNAI